jgi:preprotein translocase subunit YajC
LAQATQAVDTQPADTTPPPWWADPRYMFYGVLILGVIFIFTSSGRATRQQEKRHQQLLAGLKRGDRVQTIGGILGSVVETRENEVVIKVDEGTNTKIRVVRDAIKKVSSGDESEAK